MAHSVTGSPVLTRATHACATQDATWDALVGFHLFAHHVHRAHQAFRLPCEQGSTLVSTAASGRDCGADGSSLVVPGIADLLCSFHPFTGSFPKMEWWGKKSLLLDHAGKGNSMRFLQGISRLLTSLPSHCWQYAGRYLSNRKPRFIMRSANVQIILDE
jgi:hypothetical protein